MNRTATYRRRAWITGWAAFAAAGLVAQLGPPAQAQTPLPTITRGAAIRQVDGVWSAIDNSAHANTLVASIVVEADGDIRVNFLPGGGRVVSANVGDDESVAKPNPNGIDCGPSMAPDHMIIRCYDQTTGAFVPGWSSRWAGPTTNLWLLTEQEPQP